VSAIVEGICDGWSTLVDRRWSDALRLLTGCQRLTYPDGGEVRTSRGILMGLGPSWPILSLIHMFWVEHASVLCGFTPRRSRYATVIGGDDLLGWWPAEMCSSYRYVLRLCGASLSDQKTFLSRSAGNFTELTFYVGNLFTHYNLGRLGRPRGPFLRWGRGIPVKGLVGSACLPGAAFESFLPDCGRALRARRVLRLVSAGSWERARSFAIPPTMPLGLGGAGLPPVRGSVLRVDAGFRHRLAIGRLLYGRAPEVFCVDPVPQWADVSTDPVSEQSRRWALEILGNEMAFGLLSLLESREPLSATSFVDGSGSVVAWLRNEVSLLSQSQLFSDSPLPGVSVRPQPAGEFSSLLRRWVKRVVGGGGLPSALAIKRGRPSRLRLLARQRANRLRWALTPTVDPDFYLGTG